MLLISSSQSTATCRYNETKALRLRYSCVPYRLCSSWSILCPGALPRDQGNPW
jgi:hypothetical protein